MDYKDLNNKNEADLQKLLAEKRNELRELRFKSMSGQLKQVTQIGAIRKEIAQILTAFNTRKN